jgi:hypothetical protein
MCLLLLSRAYMKLVNGIRESISIVCFLPRPGHALTWLYGTPLRPRSFRCRLPVAIGFLAAKA